MSKLPLWLKLLLGAILLGVVIAFSQFLLYLDRLGVGKFDL